MTAEPQSRWVSRLILTSFRSYAEAVVEVGPGPVVLAGPNGAGKTNILEALSLLSPGKGLRGAAYGEMARRGPAAGGADWAVAARVSGGLAPVDIGTGITASAAPGGPGDPSTSRRQIRIDGETATAAALQATLGLLWLTPAQDRLFVEGASGRRRFLDRLVLALYPDHAGHVARYEAAMRERARLLEAGNADPLWLAALERRMAEHGVAVAAARRHGVTALQALMDAAPDGPFPRALLALDGALEAALETAKALDVEDWAAGELASRRGADRAAGRAGFGAHRTDLAVTHAPKAMPAALCSTGEQKALLIGLILAQARLVAGETGRKPLLLLDEIAAHLDADRRAGLFDMLMNMGVQAWMTGTDLALFEALVAPLRGQGQFWTIDAGRPVRLDI
jgi:DNA replication and repair protein RecF